MILRTWGARTTLECADAFHRHLLETGIADYRKIAGCREVHLVRRDEGGVTHFLLLSFWDSLDAIRTYTGENFEVAVLYPGDEAYRLDPDRFVHHFETVSTELG